MSQLRLNQKTDTAYDTVVRVDRAGFSLPFYLQKISPQQARTEVVTAIKNAATELGIELLAAPLFTFTQPRLFVPDDDWDRLISLLVNLVNTEPCSVIVAPRAKGGLLDPDDPQRDYFLKKNRKARVFLPIAAGDPGPAWGSENGINLETCFVRPDLKESLKKPKRFVQMDGSQPKYPVMVEGVEVDSFRELAVASPDHATFQVDAVVVRDDSSTLPQLSLLRYTLRSLHMYAPWIRKIWLIPELETPPWDELAEHVLYVEPGTLLTGITAKTDFFEPNGLVRVNLTKPMISLDRTDQSNLSSRDSKSIDELLTQRYGRAINQQVAGGLLPMTRAIAELVEVDFGEKIANRDIFPSANTDMPLFAALTQFVALISGKGIEASRATQNISRQSLAAIDSIETLLKYSYSLDSVKVVDHRLQQPEDDPDHCDDILRVLDILFPITTPIEEDGQFASIPGQGDIDE